MKAISESLLFGQESIQWFICLKYYRAKNICKICSYRNALHHILKICVKQITNCTKLSFQFACIHMFFNILCVYSIVIEIFVTNYLLTLTTSIVAGHSTLFYLSLGWPGHIAYTVIGCRGSDIDVYRELCFSVSSAPGTSFRCRTVTQHCLRTILLQCNMEASPWLSPHSR